MTALRISGTPATSGVCAAPLQLPRSQSLRHMTSALTAVFALLLLCPTAVMATQIQYYARGDIFVLKDNAVQRCAGLGGTLAADNTPAVHAALTETIQTAADSRLYRAFLGGTTLRSPNCPGPGSAEASLACVWYWETGEFEEAPVAFYRGNLRPVNPTYRPGLDGAGPLNSMPTYWPVVAGGQSYPGTLHRQHLILFRPEVASPNSWWADNGPGPDFDYMPYRLQRNFYILCRVVSTTSTSTPSPSDHPSSSHTGGEGSGSSSTGGKSSSASSWSPSASSTSSSAGGTTGSANGGQHIPLWMAIAICTGIAAFLVALILVLCLCRRQICAGCCPESSSAMANDYEDSEDGLDSSKAGLGIPEDTPESPSPKLDTGSVRRHQQRASSIRVVPAALPEDQEEPSLATTDTVIDISSPQSGQAAANPLLVPSGILYINGAAAPVQAYRGLNSVNKGGDRMEGNRSFRLTRTVSFVE